MTLQGLNETLFSRVRADSVEWRWPNFTREEMSCKHCGEFYDWPEFMDKLQDLRNMVGSPLNFTSAHRCAFHNAIIGGRPKSEHLRIAVDIKLAGHDRFRLAAYARDAGFTGFGYYQSFLHLDLGRPRYWFGGKHSEELWQS